MNESAPVFVPSPNFSNPVGDRLKTLLNPDEPVIEDSDTDVVYAVTGYTCLRHSWTDWMGILVDVVVLMVFINLN